MRIILARHGQTDWNVLLKYQGRTDIDLNDKGRAQAKILAKYLSEHESPIEAIYCSDLSRSRETAEIIGEILGIAPALDSRFREIHFGAWEGLTYPEVGEKYPQALNEWLINPLGAKIPDGELIQAAANRSVEGVRDIASKHKGTVVIVSHGGLIKTLLSHLNAPFGPETYLASGSVSILECTNDSIIPVAIGKPVY